MSFNPHSVAKALFLWDKEKIDIGLPYSFRCSSNEARKIFARFAHRKAGYVPSKWTKYFNTSYDVNQDALKLQPGVTVPITIAGKETQMYIESLKRLNFRGKPWYVQMRVNLDTENLPVFVGYESRCACRYCGTEPVSDETSCRACGAPLPKC